MCKRFLIFAIGGIFFLFASCSAFRSNQQIINISASQPDAQIWVDDSYAGKTPAQISVMRNKPVRITVKKEGFEPATKVINNHLSTTGVLDIIGTFPCLFPIVGLVTPGAWDLDETEIHMSLLEKKD